MFFKGKKIAVNLPGSHLNMIPRLCHSVRNQFFISRKRKAKPFPMKNLYITHGKVKVTPLDFLKSQCR